MANKSRTLKFPINEPAPSKRKTQVEEYTDFYDSAGCPPQPSFTAGKL
jgi:4-hydroxyphenylpyruvate dioxygenase